MRWALLVLRDRLELKDEDVERHLHLTARQKFVLPVFRALAALEPERAVNCLFKIGLGLEDRLRRKLDRVVEADPLALEASRVVADPDELPKVIREKQLCKKMLAWLEARLECTSSSLRPVGSGSF